MIRILAFISLLGSFYMLSSCQKELSFATVGNSNQTPPPGSPPPGNQKLYRIQQGVDPDLNNDTIWIISYDAAGRIKSIVDSLYQDTLVANYDVSGKLTSAVGSFGEKANYVYNANNQLSEISYTWAGSTEKFVFTYAGGTLQKRSYYSDLGTGGALAHMGEFIYTFTGGNITNIKIYTASGSLVSNLDIAYGSDPNPLKELSLFNYANRLGMDYIMDIETYFNKNLWTKATSPALSLDFTNVYVFNSQRLTKAMSNQKTGGAFTWQFYYK